MIILLVRHGETAHNLLGLGGTVGNDALLNETGKKQAANAASICREFNVKSIWTSPFLRCKDTAQFIAEATSTPTSVHEDVRLKEFDMGDWANLTLEETKRLLMQNNAWDYSREKYDFRVPGGESWHDVANRCNSVLDDIKLMDEAVVIVSHNATIRAFVGLMRGTDFKDWFGFSFANAAVSAFELVKDSYQELFVNKV